jgi:spoIIIJ-associated protein
MEQQEIKVIIEDLLRTLPVRFDAVEVVDNGVKAPVFVIKTTDAPLLIGTRGAHFQALSHLVKKLVGVRAEIKKVSEPRFFIDINDYRSSLSRTLANKASVFAERARSFKSSVEMEPMSAYDRLIVHEFLDGAPNIKTESVGQGKERRVVIRYIEDSFSEKAEKF